MSVFIRKATRTDAARLSELHRQCFEEPWDEAAFARFLAHEHMLCLIGGESETELQSFILIQRAAGEAEILSLATLPAARRKGLARELLARAAAHCANAGDCEIFLDVALANQAARALYAAAGFSEVGHRPRYYARKDRPPEDAAILRANLPLSQNRTEKGDR